MRLIPVTSSSVAAIGWKPYLSPETIGHLAVQFQTGRCYVYEPVPIDVFVKVITDPDSQGKALNELVKKAGYQYRETDLAEIEAK